MTFDQVLRAVIEAIQPHLDTDRPNPQGIDEMVVMAKRLFAEEPNMEQAFSAAVRRVAELARMGWVKQ